MPRRRPNPGTASKPVDRSASAQPSLDEQGNPVRRKPGPKPKVDEFGNRINPPRPKTDEEVRRQRCDRHPPDIYSLARTRWRMQMLVTAISDALGR